MKHGPWLSLLALALAAASGCKRADRASTTAPPAASAPATSTPAPGTPAAPATTKTYGAPLTAAAPVPIERVLAKPEEFRAGPVTVEGQVRKACTRKGCWMELAASSAPASPGCRVTFKDYGFFVPTDSAGATARVQGLVEVDTLSAAAVRHYEEEGAHFPNKKPDGTAPEVRLVATGVEMWR